MQGHATGAIQGTRTGSIQVLQSFVFGFALLASNTKLLTIKASAAQPVAIRTTAVIMEADNSGTSAALSVGTSAGGTQLLNGVNMKSAAGTNYVPTNNVLVVTADTDIYAVAAKVGTAATAGKMAIMFSIAELNVGDVETP